MHQPQFIVRLADLERGKRQYDWALPTDWLTWAFEGTEASIGAPGRLVFEASKTSRQVIIRGKAEAAVTMPCVRTLDPVPVSLSSEVFLVLRPAAPAHEGTSPAAVSAKKKRSVPVDPAKREQPSSVKLSRRPESELSDDEAAEDTYQRDSIALDEFVREFLVLELPMMPLRSDLRSGERPAIPGAPEPPDGGASSPTVDPRLLPLAALASRLKKKTKE